MSFDDNQILRTLPDVANYSAWGFGKSFNLGKWYDSAASYATMTPQYGIDLGQAGHWATRVRGNQINDVLTAIHVAAPVNRYDVRAMLIDGNRTFDVRDRGILIDGATGTPTMLDLTIRNNDLDGDYFRRNANSNANGSYKAQTTPYAIDAVNVGGLTVEGNTYRNWTAWYNDNYTYTWTIGRQYMDISPVGAGFSTSNKGMGTAVDEFSGMISRIRDSDPTSATFGEITSVQLSFTTNGSPPQSGFYFAGHFVINAQNPLKIVGAPGPSYYIKGWLRVRTGGGNAVGIASSSDWFEQRVYANSTPVAYTYADLPTCNATTQDMMAIVTDSRSPTYGGSMAGGGSTRTLAYCTGTAWVAH